MPRVEGSEVLKLEPAEVWRLLNDPDVLGRSIPGCKGFERDGDAEHRYRTSISVAVGAVKGTYAGTVEYRDVEEPERCTIVVSGKGDKGSINGEGRISLKGTDSATDVGYEGTFKITGPIAGVGQRLAPGVSRKMIVETLRNLERRGSDGAGAGAAAEPAVLDDATPERRQDAGATDSREAGDGETQTATAAEPFRPFGTPAWATFVAGCIVGAAIALIVRAFVRTG